MVEAFRSGRTAAALADAVPDHMVTSLTASGTRDEVAAQISAYDGLADSVKLTPPTHGLTPPEIRLAQKELIAVIGDLSR